MNTTANNAVTPYPAELKVLLQRAHAGDQSAVPEVRAALKQYPELVDQLGNLAGRVEAALVELASGGNVLGLETLRAHLAQMREELGLAEAAPLESLLIERIVLCWLQVHHADLEVAAKLQLGQGGSQGTGFTQRRQQQAHVRLLTAIKTLATVRKLLVRAPSPVQVATRLAGKAEVPATVQARREAVLVSN